MVSSGRPQAEACATVLVRVTLDTYTEPERVGYSDGHAREAPWMTSHHQLRVGDADDRASYSKSSRSIN